MIANHPDVAYGSTNKYQNWEVVDPEKWVPHGYACVRVDSRGTGRSPGFIDHFSPRETRDLYECIEWAARQTWSNGKIGLSGVSYYGINQWHVASLQPPHLEAMCIWEGAADWYRDMTHHGGILSTFWANWYDMQVKTVQYGLGERGPRNAVSGLWVCGDETLSDDELARNRCSFGDDILGHPLDDDYHRARSPQWDKVTVPFLSAANWGGQGLHPRGNFEGFMRAASQEKWLEAHGLEHWTHFYTDYGQLLQKAFFDCYLKGENNGWRERHGPNSISIPMVKCCPLFRLPNPAAYRSMLPATASLSCRSRCRNRRKSPDLSPRDCAFRRRLQMRISFSSFVSSLPTCARSYLSGQSIHTRRSPRVGCGRRIVNSTETFQNHGGLIIRMTKSSP